MIGFYCIKVKNVVVMCWILFECYDGEVLVDCEVFEGLLGVGCKMVNVVLNIVFGQLMIVVDMYIFCVVNCIGFVLGKDVWVVEVVFEKFMLKEFLQDVYYWLILYGCYVCKVWWFECWYCVIELLCEFWLKMLLFNE